MSRRISSQAPVVVTKGLLRVTVSPPVLGESLDVRVDFREYVPFLLLNLMGSAALPSGFASSRFLVANCPLFVPPNQPQLKMAEKRGGSGGARTRNLCRDRAAL